ncbi:MAG TPA: RNA methyltransferase [Solirubrobacteraceae bacterium]|nr:RNA methyltransferase [Solirubrobacteraceae bacterium]
MPTRAISSPHNPKLKEIRKLSQRRRWRELSGLFVAEGEDLLAAADAAGWEPIERYCASGSGLPGTEVEPRLLASACGLASGTRTLAVYRERWSDHPVGPLCIYLHALQDPGNIGTVLRSAEAFGASSVVLGPTCADPYSPKAVRASMGAVFTVALARADPGALPGLRVALVPGQGVPLSDLWRSGLPLAGSGARELSLLLGSERTGLPKEVAQQADITAHIPARNHSLNVAMAATVALYELATRMARP